MGLYLCTYANPEPGLSLYLCTLRGLGLYLSTIMRAGGGRTYVPMRWLGLYLCTCVQCHLEEGKDGLAPTC